MALYKRFWHSRPSEDIENFPKTLEVRPGLYNNNHLNVAETLDFARNNWSKAQAHTIILTIYTDAQLEEVFTVGSGEVSEESIEYCLRNDLVGWEIYRAETAALFDALKADGFTVDHIAMDLEGYIPSKGRIFGAIPMTDVLANIYVNDADGIPIPNPPFPTLDIDSLLQDQYKVRAALLANGIWSGWCVKEVHRKFDEIFGEPARAAWPKCMISNYDLAVYPNHPILDWGTTADPNQIYNRFPRPSVDVRGIGAPVLYLHKDYYDNADEAIASLHCCDPVTTIPWVGHEWHRDPDTGEIFDGISGDWKNNTAAANAKILLAVERFGCERVMVF